MRYFIDTEFREEPNTIELISIGIVSEEGQTFYAENINFPPERFDSWLRENVLPHLRWHGISYGHSSGPMRGMSPAMEIHDEIPVIAEGVRDWIRVFGNGTRPEFWGYYSAYDWVAFSWLFGRLIDLPDGWPRYCRDIKQLMDEAGNPKKPEQEDGEHNALADAKYCQRLYNWIRAFQAKEES